MKIKCRNVGGGIRVTNMCHLLFEWPLREGGKVQEGFDAIVCL